MPYFCLRSSRKSIKCRKKNSKISYWLWCYIKFSEMKLVLNQIFAKCASFEVLGKNSEGQFFWKIKLVHFTNIWTNFIWEHVYITLVINKFSLKRFFGKLDRSGTCGTNSPKNTNFIQKKIGYWRWTRVHTLFTYKTSQQIFISYASDITHIGSHLSSFNFCLEYEKKY